MRLRGNEYDAEEQLGKLSWYPGQSGQVVAESGLCREGMRKPTTSAKEFTKASSLSNPPESIRRSRGKMQQVTIEHQIYIAALAPHLASLAFEQCS